jgi:predicted DCC family thiol-disulfide oxidoreductase YuxK
MVYSWLACLCRPDRNILPDGFQTGMNGISEKQGVWFVYDGACPICNMAAQAFRIRQKYGALHLVNAREIKDDPLIEEINRQGFDLDEGMVIYCEGQFYHGKDALAFMARYGETRGLFNRFNKVMFRTNRQTTLLYPLLRGVRNLLLRLRGVGKIDNLHKNDRPTFQSIFGKSWDSLPTVLKSHYANRPYSDDITIAEGVLDVMCKLPLIWLAPLMKSMGQIPVHNEKNVPVTVRFESERNSKAFHFNRTFHFKNSRPYAFRSKMLQIRNNEVIEIMRFGLGWKMLYLWDGSRVILQHRGYAVCLAGLYIPVPLTLIMGKGYAEEIPIDDETFDMITHITHPWWGRIYEYKGRFKMAPHS